MNELTVHQCQKENSSAHDRPVEPCRQVSHSYCIQVSQAKGLHKPCTRSLSLSWSFLGRKSRSPLHPRWTTHGGLRDGRAAAHGNQTTWSDEWLGDEHGHGGTVALHVVFRLSINRSSYGEDCRACQGITCQTTALCPAGHPHIKTRTHHFKTRTPSRNQEPAQLHMALPLGLPGTTFLDTPPHPALSHPVMMIHRGGHPHHHGPSHPAYAPCQPQVPRCPSPIPTDPYPPSS
uniref:uncharacterized protein LOC124021610 n=1 Tax=Oncorhynchus gorbuscha TaxID=8017 RepID=UPI001EAF241B|nr:uncharacterized protein LOC124021610 [Oncorhynchus gorbuscha]